MTLTPEQIAEKLTEAKLRLNLARGSLDCNVEDELFWERVITFLEEEA